MKTKTIVTAIVLTLCTLVACSGDAPSTPEQAVHLTAETAPLPHLLPEATLLAVEFRNLVTRWDEVRAVRPLARFQDELLEELGLSSDELPMLTGDHCVFALVSGSGGRVVMPVVLLLPPSAAEARAHLGSLADSWALVRARGALWIGPGELRRELEAVARGDGTSLADAIPMDEISQSLPAGGLVRGWVNPAALLQLIGNRLEGRVSAVADMAAGFLSAELEAVRWIGFRRELESSKIVTDAVVAYDLSMLPAEVSALFNPRASSPPLPTALPKEVVIAVAFRPESAASLHWLRYVAERNATNSLRHLQFWIDEFEQRFDRSLKADLFDAIGEHGWLLGLQTGTDMSPAWVMVLQTSDPSRVEATLLDLLSWSSEHAWARTLGFAVPRVANNELDGTTMHAVALHTPFGQLAGPVFAAVQDHLVTATDQQALQTGVSLVESRAFSIPDGERTESIPAHASLWARQPSLVGLTESLSILHDADSDHTVIIGAVAGLLAGVVSAAARAWYEEDALRMHGEILLDGSG